MSESKLADFTDNNTTLSVDSTRHSNKVDVYFTDKANVPFDNASKDPSFSIARTHRVGERTIPYIGYGHYALVSRGFEQYECHVEFPTPSKNETTIANVLPIGTFSIILNSDGTTLAVDNKLTDSRYGTLLVIVTSNDSPMPTTYKIIRKLYQDSIPYGPGSHFLVMVEDLEPGPANGSTIDFVLNEVHVSNGTPLGPISFMVAGAPNLASS